MSTKPIIKNVFIYYSKLKTPELKMNQKPDPKKPLRNKEYIADVLLKADDLKELRKKYRKAGVKAFQEIKSFTKEEFQKRFKVDPPAAKGYTNEDGEYDILKVRKAASYSDGTPAEPRPAVVGFGSLGGQSKNGYDINHEVLMSNGTEINLQLRERKYNIPSGGSGTALDLWKIQVINLIPYEEEGFEDEGEDIESKAPQAKDEDIDEEFDDEPSNSSEPVEDDEEWDD